MIPEPTTFNPLPHRHAAGLDEAAANLARAKACLARASALLAEYAETQRRSAERLHRLNTNLLRRA